MWLARRWADPRMESCRCWDCGGGPASDGLLLTASSASLLWCYLVASWPVVSLSLAPMASPLFLCCSSCLGLLRLLPPACLPRTTGPMITSCGSRDRQSCRCRSILLIGCHLAFFPWWRDTWSGKLAKETWPESVSSWQVFNRLQSCFSAPRNNGTNQLGFIYWLGSSKYLAAQPLVSSYYFFRM
ncbi:hypothetical protein BO85DRAFT_175676 [Aspergillus piperis CBS 112811]|uniref:Uncharacterized protein n=1 Tax=Aspergillus piperis CBS 112811 TaxID=1448313 RepID=A0A8G1QWH9_9EURO|nr:hypothetical protein BO85DRAFT_175676 [Aspergillus piperis CBS 112811]RAH52660.1 hypothetical protein BO85DRAFT_175676 [Aspergillus piperis CBS 112811]